MSEAAPHSYPTADSTLEPREYDQFSSLFRVLAPDFTPDPDSLSSSSSSSSSSSASRAPPAIQYQTHLKDLVHLHQSLLSSCFIH